MNQCPTHETCPGHAHIEEFPLTWQPPTPRHEEIARELTDDCHGYGELGYVFTKAINRIVSTEPRTITTSEGLKTLPDGSLTISGDRWSKHSGAVWKVSAGMVERVDTPHDGVIPIDYFIDPLPVKVLREGF